MLGPGGRGKTRTKLEKLLRQDHSDVYFDNDRLNDQLNQHIEDMQKELHKHDLQRGIEIGKLRKEIIELRAQVRSNLEEEEEREHEPRPHTSVGHSTRKRTATASGGVRKRAQSAWARTSDSKQEAAKPEEREENQSPRRSDSPSSSVSSLRNTRTLRRYHNIGANSFKENGRFPEEWYVRCLPASDAAIHNARKKVGGKLAPPLFDFLGKLREKDIMEKKLAAYTTANKKLVSDKPNGNGGNDSEEEGLNLICEEPVKPVLMSRRRLMEISNAGNLVDRGPSRNTQRKQNIKDLNALEYKKVEEKVQEFCRMIEDLKKKELEAVKHREEAMKQEALEKLQLQALEAEKEAELKKQAPKASKDDDDDDFRYRKKWK